MEGHPNDLPTYYSNIMLMIWLIKNLKNQIIIILNVKNQQNIDLLPFTIQQLLWGHFFLEYCEFFILNNILIFNNCI